MVATTVFAFGDGKVALKRDTKQVFVETDLLAAELRMFASDTVNWTVVLDQYKRAIGQPFVFAHIALFVEQATELADLLFALFAAQMRLVALVQIATTSI